MKNFFFARCSVYNKWTTYHSTHMALQLLSNSRLKLSLCPSKGPSMQRRPSPPSGKSCVWSWVAAWANTASLRSHRVDATPWGDKSRPSRSPTTQSASWWVRRTRTSAATAVPHLDSLLTALVFSPPRRLPRSELPAGQPGVQSTQDPSPAARRSPPSQRGAEGARRSLQPPGQLQQAGLLPVLPEDPPEDPGWNGGVLNAGEVSAAMAAVCGFALFLCK